MHRTALMYRRRMSRPAVAVEPPAFLRLAAHPLRWQLLAALGGGDQRVRELCERLAQPQNLVSYHLRLLRDAGLVTSVRSTHDGRDSYYHLDLDRCADALDAGAGALHPALARPAAAVLPGPAAVLFVCTGNSSRSPMAEALLRHRTAGRVEVTSAGSRPKPELHPNTVRVLRESFGIDVAGRPTRHLDDLTGPFDVVVTLCDRAREVCPEFPGHPRRIHWSLPDPATPDGPAEATHPAFRAVAAEIDTRVGHLLPVLSASRHRGDPP
jgi:ArsR family transcriptional regulator, arsenate/arsenite/antimonite-responsive transcriptional repressor / arsenate reductase (thioredoxin)